MNDKVLRFIREQQLLSPGDHVVCAVSGGADSMAMLLFFLQERDTLGITLEAAHFNHLLRGEESDGDAAFAERFCAEHGIPFTCGSGAVAETAKELKCGTEEAARSLRYRFLESFDGFLATAHTADDNAETVLMNLLRGTGLHGLTGIPLQRGRIIRPLLCVTHQEAIAFLRDNGVGWREDSTNQGNAYRRNRLRHGVLPLLLDENPEFPATLQRSCALLREEDSYLEKLAEALLTEAATPRGYSIERLLAAEPVILQRALHLLCDSDYAHTQACAEQIKKGTGRIPLTGNRELVCSCGYCCVLSVEKKQYETYVLRPGDRVEDVSRGLCVSCFEVPSAPPADSHLFSEANRMYLRCSSPITIRCPQQGDRIRLAGVDRGIKGLLTGRRIPVYQRPALPFLIVQGQLAGIYSVGIADAYRPLSGEPAVCISFSTLSCEIKNN